VTGLPMIPTTLVIPAKAGIQLALLLSTHDSWTPAFAGVTKEV